MIEMDLGVKQTGNFQLASEINLLTPNVNYS